MPNYKISEPHVISEIADDEAVIINLDTGSYYNLSKDASKLWNLFADGFSLEQLLENLALAKEDKIKIEEFIAKLLAEKLISECDSASEVDSANFEIDFNNLSIEIYTDMQDLLGLDPIHEVEPEAGWPVEKSS